MMNVRRWRIPRAKLIVAAIGLSGAGWVALAAAQSPVGMAPNGMAPRALAPARFTTIDSVSPYYQEPIVPRKVKLHDIITVEVKEQSAYLSEGSVDRRKNGVYDAVIKDWVNLTSGLTLKRTPQEDGDPRAGGTIQQTYRAESQMEVRDRVELRIAATIVDVRPNGNFVIEAHKTVRHNREQIDASLTGIVRPEDITPLNTVLSEDIAELSVFKKQKGHIRDSYRRGWMTRMIDALNPF